MKLRNRIWAWGGERQESDQELNAGVFELLSSLVVGLPALPYRVNEKSSGI